MKTKFTLMPAAAITAVAMMTGTATAGDDPLEKYIESVEDIAEDLEDEFKDHFRRSEAYRYVMADVGDILDLAERIEDNLDEGYRSLRFVKRDVEELDDLTRRLHRTVDAAERGRYRGYVEGDTRYVHRMLDAIDRKVHSMERYIDHITRPRYPEVCAH